MEATSDDAAAALEAYLNASAAALESGQRIREAWRQHFEGEANAPSQEWIAEVEAQRGSSELALDRARMTAAMAGADPLVVEPPAAGFEAREPQVRVRRRRRKENTVLRAIGGPGRRLVRALILIAILAATLVATAAGISLALEIAGFLHLIDEPVQLPVGIQLAVFIAGTTAALVLRRALKPVELALYGSKGIRPRPFSF